MLGSDLSRGLGYAADAQILDSGADDEPDLDAPVVATDTDGRNVVQSIARTTLVPNSAGAFGLQSKVSQTLAPVNIADSLIIEVAGEWELTATATGIAGQSTVSYHPSDDASIDPSTPVLRVFTGPTNDIDNLAGQLLFQDLLGNEGLPIVIPGVAEIVIGEDPRAIGGDADSQPTISADGTTVSAAVDVVRVKLLDGAGGDIRVGHMEVKAQVPAGGITCPIPVSKKATPSTVSTATAPDGKFQVAITIKNPFDCDLIERQRRRRDQPQERHGHVQHRGERLPERSEEGCWGGLQDQLDHIRYGDLRQPRDNPRGRHQGRERGSSRRLRVGRDPSTPPPPRAR